MSCEELPEGRRAVPPRFYLALSGGGFRATIFHLGVIRYCRDYGLLDKVVAISSVSGGALTAAHVVLNWKAYVDPANSRFDSCQAQIRKLTRIGMRQRLIRRIPWYWLFRRFGFRETITLRLAKYYDDYLYQGKVLGDIRAVQQRDKTPLLHLMATNLTLHSSRTHFFLDSYIFQDERSQLPTINKITINGYPTGRAVAASSAFPFLFPPLRLGHDDSDVNVTMATLKAKAHYLTDGGVFENLGISVLRDLIRMDVQRGAVDPTPTKQDPRIIISDAGGRLDWDLDDKVSRGFFRRLLRSSEVSQYWSEQRLEVGESLGELVIRIDEPIDNSVVANAPSTAVQNAVGKLRTDVDTFSDLEWSALLSQGYSAAKKALASLSPRTPVAVDPYSPWQPDGTDWQDSKTAKRLQRGQRRRLRLFAFHSIDAYWFANVAIIGLLLAGGYLASKPAIRATAQLGAVLHNWARGSAPARLPELKQPPAIAGSGFQPSQIAPMTKDASQQLSLATRRFSDIAVASKGAQAALVVWQEKPFEANFGTIRRKLTFKSNAELEDGVAYFIDTFASPPATGIRVVHMRKFGPERVFRPTGGIVMDAPERGELLVMVLLVKAFKPDDPDPFPGSNVRLYNITLEVE